MEYIRRNMEDQKLGLLSLKSGSGRAKTFVMAKSKTLDIHLHHLITWASSPDIKT